MNSLGESINQDCAQQKHALQDIQYSLCSSYIKYACEKLAVREAELMAKTAILLEKMQATSDQKELTDLCTTQASTFNSFTAEDQSSFKSAERKGALKRKSKYTGDRKTKSHIMEAVQEIKEVCSERTIALTEQIFTDYQKITELQHKADFRFELLSRESNFRKKRDKCDLCENKVEALEQKIIQSEQKIAELAAEKSKLSAKCMELQHQLLKEKQGKSQLKSYLSNSSSLSSCGDFLSDREKNIEGRYKELKSIENSISSQLQSVAQCEGCKRCNIIHAIKSQIVEYRKHYQREFQLLSKLFIKYKKMAK